MIDPDMKDAYFRMNDAVAKFNKAKRQMRIARNMFIMAFVFSTITVITGLTGGFCSDEQRQDEGNPTNAEGRLAKAV